MNHEDETQKMQSAGFEWDPVRGYRRWSHFKTETTALRQPYMNEQQWEDHCSAKIKEAEAKIAAAKKTAESIVKIGDPDWNKNNEARTRLLRQGR